MNLIVKYQIVKHAEKWWSVMKHCEIDCTYFERFYILEYKWIYYTLYILEYMIIIDSSYIAYKIWWCFLELHVIFLKFYT